VQYCIKMICTICSMSECCKATFREVASSLRYEYILDEYSSLSDAWRVYQGVALYREYRGIGGVTRQLDVVPKPCYMCLVKIVCMAQSIHQVTSALEKSEIISRNSSSQSQLRNSLNGKFKSDRKEASEDNCDDNDDDDDVFTKDLSDSITSQENLEEKSLHRNCREEVRDASLNHVNNDENGEENNKMKVAREDEEIQEKTENVGLVAGRAKRSAGRSLFERKPDFALGSEFAKILRQKTIKENTRLKKIQKKLQNNNPPEALSLPEAAEVNVEGENVANLETWRTADFRSSHLSRLDDALTSAGWSAAIRSGKNMENEVFKNAKTENEYVSGIQRLINHFNKGSLPKAVKSTPVIKPAVSPKNKRMVKPSRKILDGLDFRRKVLVTKISCEECGEKFAKSKLKVHIDTMHKQESNTCSRESSIEEKLQTNNSQSREASSDRLRQKSDANSREPSVEDNLSIAESEISISSSISSLKSLRSKRSKKSPSLRSTSMTPVPDKTSSKLETEMSQKIVDEFAGSNSESEDSHVSGGSSSNFILNNFVAAGIQPVRKCSLEENNLQDGTKDTSVKDLTSHDQGRPQRRKRSMEERHPDFVHDLPVKAVKSNFIESQNMISKKISEI